MPATSRPWWSRRALWLIGALVLGGAAVAGWAWRPLSVEAVTLQPQPLVRTLQFTGRVKTPARVDVGVTITGRVAQVLVREGDVVKAGAPLVQLEAEEWQAAWGQAQAALQQAQARLASQQALALPSAEAALAQAEATLRAAERELARTQDLVAKQFYSQARLDEAQRNVAVARAQRDAARVQVSANQAQGAERAATRAQRDAAQAALEVARVKRDQATVRAPGAGRVLLRAVEPGQIVQAGKSLLTLSVEGPTELVAQVDERYLGQLQAGQRARVLADAYPQQPFEARVDRLAPAVNAQSGAVEVTLVVDGPRPAFLREDMTLSVEVLTARQAAVLALPLRAVRDLVASAQGEQGTVMVVEAGRARARPVTLGLRALNLAEVRGGLRAGDQVLLDPGVAPGQRVRPRPVDVVASPPGASGTSRDNAGGGMAQTFGR